MSNSNSFSAIFIFGEDILKQNFIHILKSTAVTENTMIFDGTKFNIYTKGSIDFIDINIDLNDIRQINSLKNPIQKFITYKKYLVSNIIYFMKYMSPKQHQIIDFLSFNNMNIQLVSLKPNKTFDEYMIVCHLQNLQTYIIKNIHFTKDEFLRIIKNIYNQDYDELYNIFIESF